MNFLSIFLCVFCFGYIKVYGNYNAVTKGFSWPVSVGKEVEFVINKKYSSSSELIIEIENTEYSKKEIPFSRKLYVDLTTEYYKINRTITKTSNLNQFSLRMSFTKESHEKFLIFRWYPYGADDTRNRFLIYRAKIKLTKKWDMSITLEVEVNVNNHVSRKEDIDYFHIGQKARVFCSATGGFPNSSLRLDIDGDDKRLISVTKDPQNNAIVGFFMLEEYLHNKSINCIISNTEQRISKHIRVIHPPQSLRLIPEYTGYAKNGSTVECFTREGYPDSIVKWKFLTGRNHSNPQILYEIKNSRIKFHFHSPIGVRLRFNCTAVYIDPLWKNTTVIYTSYWFQIGEPPVTTESRVEGVSIDYTGIRYGLLSKAAIGAAVAAFVVLLIAVSIVIMVCRNQPKSPPSPNHRSTVKEDDSPKYAGSLLAGSKVSLKNQMKKAQNGTDGNLLSSENQVQGTAEPTDYNYDDMPRGRRPIKVINEPIIYSTIVGTMQPKNRPSLDIGPIDRV